MMKVMKCPKSGAIHCVDDLTGYGGWVESGSTTRLPSDEEVWDEEAGDWCVCPDLKQKKKKTEELKVENLLKRIEALETYMEKLKNAKTI